MLQSSVPFSEFVLSTYQGKIDLPNRQLEEKVRDVIDLVKYRSRKEGVEEACRSLKDDLFDLMMEIYKLSDKAIIDKTDQYVITELNQQRKHQSIYHQLQHTYINNVELYLDMVRKLKPSIVHHQSELSSLSSSISYHDLRTILVSLFPNAHTDNELQLLDAVLAFDFSLIATNLVMREELMLDDEEIHSLEQLLNSSLENVGVYMALLHLWQPSDDQEGQLYRNIKIRLAAHELADDQGIHATRDSLQQYLNADST
jgi:hypothetical protein